MGRHLRLERPRLQRLREGEPNEDWTIPVSDNELGQDRSEKARFTYYEGENPSWPEDAMRSDMERLLRNYRAMAEDERTPEQIIAQNEEAGNPVATKGLTNVALGAPQAIYNGGLVRATVRYFDADRHRPGLPEDVAAFVDRIGDREAGVRLVNTSIDREHAVILQAGAFGEHRFETARGRGDDPGRVTDVQGKHLTVVLPPGTSLELDVGMSRFAHKPGYAFPWHTGGIPVPFQWD